MKLIYLFGGKVAKVSDEDHDALSRFSWSANGNGYAARHVTLGVNDHRKIEMHREVMGFPEGQWIDHRDGDRLNNARDNLRLCNRSQNLRNTGPKKGRKFKGTNRNGTGWSATIRQGPRGGVISFHLGTFSTEEAAARAYDQKAHHLDPEFARLNFADGIWSDARLSEFRLEPQKPSSGLVGVQWNGGGWAARVKRGGKNIHVGQFKTKEEAMHARANFISQLSEART